MECNKEEAIRAKGIAVNKMQNKQFEAARKIALKAQQLYKDLDNISKMLMVCDVHCCAEKKLFGNEMDWYGILQIEQTADEATIKKQYRKFALLLHPDKNKFPGAEAAFKLIGEAQRVLLDKGKRSLHDMKRRPSISKPAPSCRPQQWPAYSPNAGVQKNFRNNFMGVNPQQQQTQQPAGQQGFSNGRATFWTACPFCSVKYQYYAEVMTKTVFCQNCAKPFFAYENFVHRAPTAANLNQSTFPQRQDVPSYGFSEMKVGGQGNLNAEHSKTEFFQKNGGSCGLGSEKANGKRQRKKEAESSESCDTDSSIENEEDVLVDDDGESKAGVNSGCHGEHPRRSNRRKQHVSYKENHSDDDQDFASQPKKARRSGSSCTEKESRNGLKEDSFKTNNNSGVKDESTVKQKEDLESSPNGIKGTKYAKGKQKACENDNRKSSKAHIDSASDSSSKSTIYPAFYDYPDPQFNDFNKGRNADCFSTGQIWAVYDNLDGMPRFYARIRKVLSLEFKLRITWLEPNPDGVSETEWVDEGLPASCGKFENGSSENTEDRLMFSHIVNWEKGSRRDTYKIFPRKGEIWAVFKNWDINWKNDADRSQKYEYEFVEVLSEFTEGLGASVVYLGKVKGFVSLFCRIRKEGKDSFQILPGEIFRFSHMIPSFKLTGEEREGVPKGSFELDPLSLPKIIKEITVPKDYVVEDGNSHPNGSFSRSTPGKVKPEVETEASSFGRQTDGKGADLEPEVENIDDDCSVSSISTMEAIEIPEPEFFNFDAEKSIGKFKVGQIWSLYSDEDGLPKYYSRITKVSSGQGFELRLKWLIACAQPKNVIKWNDKDMPVCCGKFKIGWEESYTDASCFSHQVRAEPGGKKNEYTILPQKGQVWALYRNWSPAFKLSDLKTCQYEAAEVLQKNDSWIKVLLLEQVSGFNSVFKAQSRGGSSVTMQVPCAELLRFSHQIPAFQLTDQRNGSLRGFWELDPAAFSVDYFNKK